MSRTAILRHTRTAVRVVLFSAIGTGVLAGAGFAGTHFYIEKKDPTPSTWPQSARFAYRAAVFNNDYLEQGEAAKIHIRTALNAIREAKDPDGDTASQIVGNLIDIQREARTEDPDEGIARLLILLGNIQKKQGDLEEALQSYTAALPETLFNMQLQSSAARRLGEIQEVYGMTREAEDSFNMAVHSLLPQYRSNAPVRLDGTMRYSPELLESVKTLALFRARQGKLKEALATLLSVLQYQQSHPAIQNQPCETASTMSNLAELVLALGDKTECQRWVEESLAICSSSKNKDKRYCVECAGMNFNLLGLLALKQSELQDARMAFSKAIILAERAGDAAGSRDYAQNMDRCV